jgi:hypothetical protein
MDVIGWIATIVVVAVIIVAVAVGLRSVPDARRYLKMRKM